MGSLLHLRRKKAVSLVPFRKSPFDVLAACRTSHEFIVHFEINFKTDGAMIGDIRSSYIASLICEPNVFMVIVSSHNTSSAKNGKVNLLDYWLSFSPAIWPPECPKNNYKTYRIVKRILRSNGIANSPKSAAVKPSGSELSFLIDAAFARFAKNHGPTRRR